MVLLVLAALLWFGVHVGIAGTRLRDAAVARLGAAAYRIVFSLLSVLTLVLLIRAYVAAPTVELWFAPDGLRWVLVAIMLPTCLLFVASVAGGNATAVGGEAALARPPRGIARVTRHPMLWAFTLWGVVHMVGNGDVAALLFFGAIAVTALAGMPSIDGKLAARDPAHWPGFAAGTSIVPGKAIVDGRNRFVPSEIPWPVWLGGAVLWLLLLFGHRHIIGVAPVAGLPG